MQQAYFQTECHPKEKNGYWLSEKIIPKKNHFVNILIRLVVEMLPRMEKQGKRYFECRA